jgi:hypothetical protein
MANTATAEETPSRQQLPRISILVAALRAYTEKGSQEGRKVA